MPRKKTVKIKFQYFQACCLDGDQQTEKLFDFESWINNIEPVSLANRVREELGIKGYVEGERLTHPHEFYALNFIRMDDTSDAYKVKEGQPAEHIDLEDDEYIGRSTAVLYDAKNHILMIQKNRGGYGAAAIQTYINALSTTKLCYLRQIVNILEVEKCIGNRIAKLDVRFANIRSYRPGRSRDFEKIVDGMNGIEGLTGHIELGMGFERKKSLSAESICEVIEDLRGNREAVSTAKIVLDDDTKSTLFDLFENAESDTITFTLPARGELGFEYRSDSMDEQYFLSRARITRSLCQE